MNMLHFLKPNSLRKRIRNTNSINKIQNNRSTDCFSAFILLVEITKGIRPVKRFV